MPGNAVTQPNNPQTPQEENILQQLINFLLGRQALQKAAEQAKMQQQKVRKNTQPLMQNPNYLRDMIQRQMAIQNKQQNPWDFVGPLQKDAKPQMR